MVEIIKDQETLQQGLESDIDSLIKENKDSEFYKIIKENQDPLTDIDAKRARKSLYKKFPYIYKFLIKGEIKEVKDLLNSKENCSSIVKEKTLDKLESTLEGNEYIDLVIDEERNLFYEVLDKYGFIDENGNYINDSLIRVLEEKFENIKNLLLSVYKNNNGEYDSEHRNKIIKFSNKYFYFMDIFLNSVSNLSEKELPKDGKFFFLTEIYGKESYDRMLTLEETMGKEVILSKINNLKNQIDKIFFIEPGIFSNETDYNTDDMSNISEKDIISDKSLKGKFITYYDRIGKSLEGSSSLNKEDISEIYYAFDYLKSLMDYLSDFKGDISDLQDDDDYKNYLFRLEYKIKKIENQIS